MSEIMLHKIHIKLTSNVFPVPCNNCINMTSFLSLISRNYSMVLTMIDTLVIKFVKK